MGPGKSKKGKGLPLGELGGSGGIWARALWNKGGQREGRRAPGGVSKRHEPRAEQHENGALLASASSPGGPIVKRPDPQPDRASPPLLSLLLLYGVLVSYTLLFIEDLPSSHHHIDDSVNLSVSKEKRRRRKKAKKGCPPASEMQGSKSA